MTNYKLYAILNIYIYINSILYIYYKGKLLLHELSIIKTFLSYDVWCKYKDMLSITDISKELHPVYSVLDNYHRTNEHKHSLSVTDLSNLLFAMSPKDKEYYVGIIRNLENMSVKEDTVDTLIHGLVSARQLKEISLAAYDVSQGRMKHDAFDRLLLTYKGQGSVHNNDRFEFVTDDLQQLANDTKHTRGLRWRLDTLNKMLGSLRKGDFGFLFARPESGKTTFLASETTYMAEQLSDEDGPIIWLNNEEGGSKVKLRSYQATLGITSSALLSNIPKHQATYKELTKGKHLIYDNAIITKRNVERICAQYKPSLLVFDQIDKVYGFDNDREDLKLGAIYQWARELAKTYCPVIGVCQASGTGENVKWLSMTHVANAHTAKQAEADWILGIGKIHDAGYESLRYLHASKNKLLGDDDTDEDQRHGKREVLIRPNTARYEDLL